MDSDAVDDDADDVDIFAAGADSPQWQMFSSYYKHKHTLSNVVIVNLLTKSFPQN